MRETYVDMGDRIDTKDEQRLEDLLATLQPDEKLILTMERTDAHETEGLILMLEEKGFTVEAKGGHGDDYYLHCWRRPEDNKD